MRKMHLLELRGVLLDIIYNGWDDAKPRIVPKLRGLIKEIDREIESYELGRSPTAIRDPARNYHERIG